MYQNRSPCRRGAGPTGVGPGANCLVLNEFIPEMPDRSGSKKLRRSVIPATTAAGGGPARHTPPAAKSNAVTEN
ncbi:MAG: hypothetical protein JWO38_1624 [Gemmataceae bacterium]|nr:hypothetical protein [Gemmataceae bacterium]